MLILFLYPQNALFTYINSIGDIEQINTLDQFSISDDESSYTTIPLHKQRYHPLNKLEKHLRNCKHCHGEHSSVLNHKSKEDGGLYVHVDKVLKHNPHKKDAYGHHIFKRQKPFKYSNKNVVDDFMFYSCHYPPFPFDDVLDDKEEWFERNRAEYDEDDLGFIATFH